MSDAHSRTIADGDARAEANLCASLAMLPGAEVTDTPQFLRIRTTIPHAVCNPLFARTLPADSALSALLADQRAYYAARDMPHRWYLTPRATYQPDAAIFVSAGLSGRVTGSMVRGMTPAPEPHAPPAACEIAEITGEAGWQRWCSAFADGYGLPRSILTPLLAAYSALPYGPNTPLRHFLAYCGGVPIATASLLLAGGAAGIYWVSTVPAARGRGLGAAMTRAALEAGREAGMAHGVLQATPLGRPVYRRLGFVDGPPWVCYEDTVA